MSVVRNRGLFMWISVLLLGGSATAQQKMLWQGVVKPEAVNVYQSASTSERVTTTLRQGDVVNVVLEINVMGDAWCRISRAETSEPLGFVLCFNVEQNRLAPKKIAHSEPVASQSHTQASAKSTTPLLTEATVANPVVLSNKDILDMKEMGLPPEILAAKIKSSQCNFDTSPSQLRQLKAAGLGDSVILAMVQAPVGQPQSSPMSADPPPTENAKPISSTAVVLSAPKQQIEQGDGRPCVILKRMGPADEITSHLYSFGIRGKQFQSVEGQLPAGVNFHGRLTDHDVRSIENKGGKVVIIEVKYTIADLEHARQECHEK